MVSAARANVSAWVFGGLLFSMIPADSGKAGDDRRHGSHLLQILWIRSSHKKAHMRQLCSDVDGRLSVWGRIDERDIPSPLLELTQGIPHRTAAEAQG